MTATGIDGDVLRRMKALGMSDEMIGEAFGCKSSMVKKLRRAFGVAGLRPTYRTARKGRPKAETLGGWPQVMAPDVRDKRWAAYFKKLGRDFGDDDVTIRRVGRMMGRADISHLHGLGGSSLHF